jgi:hypothetical protein
MSVLEFINSFRTSIWEITSNIFITSAIILFVSTLVIWFVTESVEKIFRKKMGKYIKWQLSIIIVLGIAYLQVVLFESTETICYMIYIGIFSIAATMFVYQKAIKILIRLWDTLAVKVETLMVDEQEELIKAQNNLLSRKIIRDQLIIKREYDEKDS